MTKTILNLAAILIAFNGHAQKYGVPIMYVETGKWGYSNEMGATFIPLDYLQAGLFSEGWAVVQNKDAQFFFLGVEGGRVVSHAADVASVKGDFHNGLIAAKVGSKWGYSNSAGKMVIDAKYEDPTEFNEGHAAVSRSGKFYILNTRGEETPVDGSRIGVVRHFSQKLAPFESNNLFGFLDENGKIAIPAAYDGVGYFEGGIAWARDAHGLIGILNTKGDWVFTPQFSFVINAHPGSEWLRCKDGRGWLYVNAAAKVLRVKDCDAWGDFSDGLAPGRKLGAWGFFDTSGHWAIEPKFAGVRDFKNGFAGVKKKGKWGIIDKSGNWIIQPIWDGIKDMGPLE